MNFQLKVWPFVSAQVAAVAAEFGFGLGLFGPWQLWMQRPQSLLLIPIQLIGFGAGVIYYYGIWVALGALIVGALAARLRLYWLVRPSSLFLVVLAAWLFGVLLGGIFNATGHTPKL